MPSDPRTRRALAHASRALGDHDIAPQATARTPAEALEPATASIRGAPESHLLELRAHAFRLIADIDQALATRAARRAAAELAP